MAILASMALFALASASEAAKGAKTRALIAKLDVLVMAKYESYRTRRVPVDVQQVAAFRNYTPSIVGWAQARLDVIRELMRMELPDRFTDITDAPVTKMKDSSGNVTTMARSSASVAYLATMPTAPSRTYESAKCLYLFVAKGTDDPDVMQQFSPEDIATDTDGMNYFVDAWGEPIFLLRWAPGFQSPLQPWNVNSTDALGHSNTNKTYPTVSDPIDPMQVYKPGAGDLFNNPNATTAGQIYPPLFPLIFSNGPDKIGDIFLTGASPPFQYSTTSPPNNPFALVSGGLLGAPTDLPSDFTPVGVNTGDGVDNSVDNISNHDLTENQ
jgi:hypothetical protein